QLGFSCVSEGPVKSPAAHINGCLSILYLVTVSWVAEISQSVFLVVIEEEIVTEFLCCISSYNIM
ncbi:hypothetical protein ACQP3L_39900, partial [Escherichia coli]